MTHKINIDKEWLKSLPDDDDDCIVVSNYVIQDAKNWRCIKCGRVVTPSDPSWIWMTCWWHKHDDAPELFFGVERFQD
jgi:hypothetical protein